MKKFRIALIAALFVTLFGITITSFAYWDQLSTTNSDSSITIGEGATITQSVVVNPESEGNLVPSGVLVGENDVTSVVYTYTVQLNKTVATDLTLGVTSSNLLVGGVADTYGLINIDISLSGTAINGDSPVTVTVTVTLDEPADETEYDAVAGETITFDINFTAA